MTTTIFRTCLVGVLLLPVVMLVRCDISVSSPMGPVAGYDPATPKLLVSADSGAGDRLYVLEYDGTGLLQLSRETTGWTEACYLSNGETILAIQEGDIHQLDADGANPHLLLCQGNAPIDGLFPFPSRWDRVLFRETNISQQSVWRLEVDDELRAVELDITGEDIGHFRMWDDDEAFLFTEREDLYLYSFSNGALACLSCLYELELSSYGAYDVNADGKTLALAARAESSEAERLYLIDLFSLEADTLSLPGAVSRGPRFNPDQDHLAMVLTVDDTSDVYLLDIEENELQRLTFDAAVETGLVFSPAGDMLAVCQDDGGAICMDLNGETWTLLPPTWEINTLVFQP